MKELLTNPLFCLPFTLGLYLGMGFVYRRLRLMLLHPMLITIAILILLLYLFQIPYETYAQASWLINFLLGPSVVALGYILYEQSYVLRGRLLQLVTSIFVGAFVGVVSVVCLVLLFGGDETLAATLSPKSVTTPIAISISEKAGGIPSLTAVVVVITGLFGGLISPLLFSLLGIKNPIARGLALGTSAHGMGTATALELGAMEGAIAGMSIGIMGFFTSLIVPFLQFVVALF